MRESWTLSAVDLATLKETNLIAFSRLPASLRYTAPETAYSEKARFSSCCPSVTRANSGYQALFPWVGGYLSIYSCASVG